MKRVLIIWLLLAQLIIAEKSFSQIVLPQIVRDSMVLQRDATINVWGWASKGEKVTIDFNKKNFKTTTGKDGKWKIALPAMEAGGPYTMTISGKNKITLTNILIGDVWFCSGQSNMVHQLNIHDVRYADEIVHANFPEIRQFLIPTLTSLQGPKENLPSGFWNAAIGEAVRPFSAVAYFFAKQLYQKYHVPIGIINASVGGTPIEAWTSEEGLKDFPDLVSTIQKNKDTNYINSQARIALAMNAGRQNATVQDKGLTGPLPWYEINYIPKGWQTIAVPGYWEDQGISNLDGVVWYRKEIDLPASMVGKPAKVFLGRIVDADVLYINGKQVGATTYLYPQRRYPVPAGVLKEGKNIVVVKVTNNAGKGGFVSGKPYCLFAGNDTIDLKGYWQYKVGEVSIPKTGSIFGTTINPQNQPAALYNAMVAPVTNYTIKGILWYQGESNIGNATGYAQLQPAQINDWRSKWQQGNLPFLWVQLPNFMDANYLPSESQWAELREAQFKSLSVPHTGMAVAIDLGEWNDIHPDNKKDVGERLALVAEKVAYGENIVYSGPLFQSASIDGNKITLSFTNTGAGLVSKDGEPLSEFAIAGADKKFVWANAIIKGNQVIVWNDTVTAPLYVRYAWADNPVNPNLYNKDGLPASPFRTDQ
ncbi:MAG: sialate O-acetylesterase [Ferruginibacter sp.]|uniref:sialate O-acetylesterase n=1 Tax=Ferruginibacter sp. TaxID=1940288 RepID=UPI00265836CE|nr:sialate O-acetylesterase [Ferruginibacter sp.]MDB5277389.1 sialate O-acetylesterase [Ferruginibacter sp.]